MRIRVLGSGSRGNSIYIENNGTSFLIDVGFSFLRMKGLLSHIGITPDDLDGILITHEHYDHIAGLLQFLKRTDVPVYMSSGTRAGLENLPGNGAVKEFIHGSEFSIGDVTVNAFPVLHDGADPSGFCLESGGRRAVVATDLGYVTTLVRERLQGCHAILLESNHDESRLMQGPYPWHLKQRVLSKEGHLSNLHAAKAIEDAVHPELNHVVLMHLSQENNTPELARNTHAEFCADRGINLLIASQNEIGEFFEV